ncbi:hypothetical protein M413DRAFT_449510 [Hebeloma cylindrosporum]|uniref:Fe2OG dioxygenase domain-containing protein n=1 Tax=Hebeloma cylindrosporum TaxID=76867 RepID=A0A0C2Y480_HEBCY|nr:hypothetical protein M413DRAFT_449510 [Hebeloma cylindrosporum h7]
MPKDTSDADDALATFRDALADLEEPPFCTGVASLDANNSTLFYRAGNSPFAKILDFNATTDEQLAALSDACQPAPFGIAQKSVLDETIRKAGKMECTDFATQFCPYASGIVDKIRASLLQGRNTSTIHVEMYKLNVYGPGSFFKSHVDTPRSDTMFASLVVILPTKHKGGSLLFRHQGRELSFNSAEAVVTEGELKAGFVAFYSDVEHEVSVVESGYRVTLTYNLYFSDIRELTPIPPSSPLNADAEDRMKSSLEALLNDPKFLPDGGIVGFALSHKYPFKKNSKALSNLEERLKGTDALLKKIWEEALPDIDLKLKTVYRGDDEYDCLVLVDTFVDVGDELEDGFTRYVTEYYQGQIIYTSGVKKKNPGLTKAYPDARLIKWLTTLNKVNQFKEEYAVNYGNGPAVGHSYGDICLVAEIKSATERGLEVTAPNVVAS